MHRWRGYFLKRRVLPGRGTLLIRGRLIASTLFSEFGAPLRAFLCMCATPRRIVHFGHLVRGLRVGRSTTFIFRALWGWPHIALVWRRTIT
jgi:hypothetical protein